MRLEFKQLVKMSNEELLDDFSGESAGADRITCMKEYEESEHNLAVLRAEILERMGG